MGNIPVISIDGSSPAPGADSDTYERFLKWSYEIYSPLMLNRSFVLGQDHYQIIRENLEYPSLITITHYKNLEDWSNIGIEGTAIQRELRSWESRGVKEQIWYPAYALIRSFRSKSFSSAYETTLVDNARFMLLEAFRLSEEEKKKYYQWFLENVPNVFMPLYLKMPGLMKYDFFEDTRQRRRQDAREQEYPGYLSIIYFENEKSWETFSKSTEYAALRKSMRNVFPRGQNYKWYVQYQLVKSFRK